MKNLKNILIALCLVFALVFSFAACDDADETSDPTEKPTENVESDEKESEKSTNKETKATTKKTDKKEPEPTLVYKDRVYGIGAITNKLKLTGRMQKLGTGLTCDFTASGIEFNAYIEGELSFTVDVSGQTTYFTVYVDGERMPKRYEAKAGSNEIVIADFGDIALHNVRIVKQNQAQRSLTVLKELKFYGQIADAPEDKELYIEIIGDSITCGHGNLCANGTASADTTIYEDGTQAYSYLLAEKLDADYSIMGCSGIGLDQSYTLHNSGFREEDFYPKASYYRSKTELYDFSSARVPDIVIINLGQNDAGVNPSTTKDVFIQKTKELVRFIRTSYGEDVTIVWAYGMMGPGHNSYMKEAFESMGGEANGLYHVQALPQPNLAGGQSHPTVEAHEQAATTIATFILNNVDFN